MAWEWNTSSMKWWLCNLHYSSLRKEPSIQVIIKAHIADADADVKINQLYLELPINVQFRFNIADNTNLVIATGPYLACGVGGKAKFDGNASVGSVEVNGSEKVDTFGDDGLDYNRFDAGWNIGLGVEFGQILVGFDTQLGFCKIMDGDAPHNANIGITVGYKF